MVECFEVSIDRIFIYKLFFFRDNKDFYFDVLVFNGIKNRCFFLNGNFGVMVDSS